MQRLSDNILTGGGEARADAQVSPHENGPPFVPRRRPGRWVNATVVTILMAMLLSFLLRSPNWRWDVVGEYIFSPIVFDGVLLTIGLTAASVVIGLMLGVLTAWMRLSGDPILRTLASAYIWLIRSMPPLVLLLFVFFLAALLPRISFGIPFGPEFVSIETNDLISRTTAAIIGLSVYLGAYSGETFRGGVSAVPRGQWEAARALGMTTPLFMRRIIAPQAIRVIIPPLANETITMFKATSLVTVIGAAELLTTVRLIYARTFQTIPLLMVAVLWYLFLVSLAMYGQRRLERKFSQGFGQ